MTIEHVAPALVALANALRDKGISVGTAETVDAGHAITLLGMSDRETLREGLAASLLRGEGGRHVFDDLFDLHFPPAPGSALRDPGLELDSPEDLHRELAGALAAHDVHLVDRLAAASVDMLGAVGLHGNGSTGWSALKTLDSVDVQRVLTLAVRGSDDAVLAGRLMPARSRQLLARYESRVASEARLRTAASRGRDRVARHGVAAEIAQRDFLNADPRELVEMRRLVQPLARKLARTLAARARRARRGEIDVRATVRASLSTGGTPMAPVYRKGRPRRTRLVVLCDISGSVAGFSGFSAQLIQALGERFRAARVFAFVNRVDEITDLLRTSSDESAAPLLARIHREAQVTDGHGNSDYGRVFEDFVERFRNALGPRTTLLVLGDARSNNQQAKPDALRAMTQRSSRAYWLNPERRSLWGSGDSAALDYGDVVEMHECRSPHQLARFVSSVLPV